MVEKVHTLATKLQTFKQVYFYKDTLYILRCASILILIPY